MNMREKKIWKRLAGLAAALCLMMLLSGMTVLAADKVENLALGQVYTNTDQDGSITHCYRFTVKNPGTLTVSATAIAGGNYYLGVNVSLCNARGKVLTTEYINAMSSVESMKAAVFGINKGTYQIKIQTPNTFILNTQFKKIVEKSGKTQKKAVSLKKGATRYGVVAIGESAKKTDWYKITLKSPAKIKLEFDSLSNRSLYATLVPSKSAGIRGTYTIYRSGSATIQTTLGKNLPRGTYYLKVYRSVKDSSVNGIYSIKWK